MPEAAQPTLTITELAQRAGMSVRNVRAHQSRGLLPQPERRGRVAYYGPNHERALRRIKELQAGGYNLAAITALLREQDGGHGPLQQLVLAPLLENDDVRLSWAQIAGFFDQRPNRDRRRRALAAGLVRETGEGDFIAPSRRLLEGARTLLDMGMPFKEIFDLQVEVSHATQGVARRFVETCLQCALEPFGDEEVPPDRWPEVRDRFVQLSRQMTSVLAATFAVSVKRATEAILSEQLPGSEQVRR